MRKIIHKIHLCVGLVIGLIIIVVALTGCIYAFQTEIQDLTQSFRFVTPVDRPVLSPSEIQEIAEKQLPGKSIHSVTYSEPSRAAIVAFYFPDPEYYYLVYINQYSGEVLKVKNMDQDFFRFILMGHYYLWLPHDVGQTIVATTTLIFIGMLITGIILWFPKNRAARKQRFKIKLSDVRWRRKNFDLHSVFGFYVSWVAIFLAITGLIMGFKWFASAYYKTISGGETLEFYTEALSDTTIKIAREIPAVDIIWQKTLRENPGKKHVEIHYPETGHSTIGASTNPDGSTYWKTDYRYYDQYSLKEVSVNHQYGRFTNETSNADKLIRMNYDIHVGAIIGLPGKILAFFASLIVASLPVTGFLLWWGRRNKRRRFLDVESSDEKY